MSFSEEVKEELEKHCPKARHCRLAELHALLLMSGDMREKKEGCLIRLRTENIHVARKVFTLLQKSFNIGDKVAIQILVRRKPTGGKVSYVLYAEGTALKAAERASVQAVCCKRAYLRGAFLAAGSMSDPRKGYHFEIVCASKERADYIRGLLADFHMGAKTVRRKKNCVVYLKEGSQIADALNVMEAHAALLKLENVRVLKEVRNTVNRKVNCETANITKTVSAAVKQIEDITYIRDTIGFDRLSEGMKDTALMRLKYPEATLKELGELMETPIGKSGVNHRLRKLSEMAEQIREH